MPRTASDISRANRIGGLALAATHDPADYTRRMREVFKESFLEKVDPTGALRKTDPEEAARRAEAARRLHYARLSHQAVKARQAKRAKR